MTENKNVIHIKFNYPEAIQAKRDILSSQVEILNILKIIKNYHKLRSQEFQAKIKLQKKLKQVQADIIKLEKTFPSVEVPRILKKHAQKNTPLRIKESIENKPKYDSTIESQLREIKEKLNSLQ